MPLNQESLIHPSAIIAPGAQIGADTSVGPYAVIGPHVVLGRANRIGPHVVLDGHTSFGDENVVFQFASIGSQPQDLKYRGEPSTLKIGHRNVIREYVTLQPGTQGGGMETVIGDDNLFMANSHIGHDGHLGNGNVIANSAALAGHIFLGNYVTLGGLTGVHQFVRLGDMSLIGAGSMVSQDVPPYCIAQGDRAKLVGLNIVGLERRGNSSQEIGSLKELYRALFLGPGVLRARIENLRGSVTNFKLGQALLEFVAGSERGICQVRKKPAAE